MTARKGARRAPFSLGAAAVIMGCYTVAGGVAALVPGLHGAGRTIAAGLLAASLAGIAAWLAAPRLAAPAPPLLPAPPLRQLFPETERLAQRLEFDRQLDRAIERADTEPAVYELAGRALASVPPVAPGELLVLGGKRQLLVQVAEAGPDDEGPGCPAAEASQCEAMRRNRTMRWRSSDDLDACPHLADRDMVPCSAVCIPIRILGEPIGVLHRTAPLEAPLGDLEVSYLEAIGSRVESRLSVLRLAPEREESADTDGVLSAAAIERRMAALLCSLTRFTAVRCDAEHLEDYEARYGEEATQTAMRTFERAAQRVIRPDDSLGRLSEDARLLVFPELPASDAQRVLGRLSEELALQLNAAGLAPLTVGFGIVPAEPGTSVELLLDQLDAAVNTAAHGRPGPRRS